MEKEIKFLAEKLYDAIILVNDNLPLWNENKNI